MSKIISFFNHKGGVGKTTLVHNLSVALSDLGAKVLLIDADPQMNLTASLYGLSTSIEYSTEQDSVWSENTNRYLSIKEFINKNLKPEDNTTEKEIYRKKSTVSDSGYVDLLTGNIGLSEIDFDLFGIIKNKNQYTNHIPSQIQKAIEEKSKSYDFLLIDTSPSSSSSINALLVLTSHYIIAPVSPSFFSLQAIDNLSSVFQNWINLLDGFQKTKFTDGIDIRVKFLGLVVQMAKRYSGGGNSNSNFTQKTEDLVRDLNVSVTNFVDYMSSTRKSVTETEFMSYFQKHLPDAQAFIIEKCCDFTPKLRTVAEKEGIPVISITPSLAKKNGCNIEIENGQYKRSYESINKSYRSIAKALLEFR